MTQQAQEREYSEGQRVIVKGVPDNQENGGVIAGKEWLDSRSVEPGKEGFVYAVKFDDGAWDSGFVAGDFAE